MLRLRFPTSHWWPQERHIHTILTVIFQINQLLILFLRVFQNITFGIAGTVFTGQMSLLSPNLEHTETNAITPTKYCHPLA